MHSAQTRQLPLALFSILYWCDDLALLIRRMLCILDKGMVRSALSTVYFGIQGLIL